MNRWLGRPPRTRDEVRRLQVCCDSPQQCPACPFRAANAARTIDELARELLSDG